MSLVLLKRDGTVAELSGDLRLSAESIYNVVDMALDDIDRGDYRAASLILAGLRFSAMDAIRERARDEHLLIWQSPKAARPMTEPPR